MNVSIHWSEVNQKWLMYKGDVLIYDFWNCGNVIMSFPGLDKKKDTKYELIIKRIDELNETDTKEEAKGDT